VSARIPGKNAMVSKRLLVNGWISKASAPKMIPADRF